MISNNYYYLAAALPPLQIGSPPELSFSEFQEMLRENLYDRDMQKVATIRRYVDIQNLRHFWKEEPLDPHGNLSDVEMEEAILEQTGLPEYVYEYLTSCEHDDERVRNLSQLVATYFREETAVADGFIKDYLTFEREMRLVFVGFRCKQWGRELARELQWEDPQDDLIVQLMAQKDAKSYEPPSEYEGLKGLFEEHKDNPLELNKALAEYRFNKVTEFCPLQPFSLDWILAYLVQLMIVERWAELDRQAGAALVESVVQKTGAR